MTPDELVNELHKALPDGLRSVVLYGSAAAGDHVAGASNYNVLVVAHRLGEPELSALCEVAGRWAREGNRPPLLFRDDELARSADVFPIEILDIQQSGRVLFGDNLLAGVVVDPRHLRLELERELKAAVLRLRERYLLTGGRNRAVVDLVAASASTFLVLFRAALRLWTDDVPARKQDALMRLSEHIGFDPQAFLHALQIRAGERASRGVDGRALFEAYSEAVETVARAVDRKLKE